MDFATALTAHQQGKFGEAEALYARVLKANPNDFNAIHLLGVLALQTGRISQGVELIRRAIEINGNVADAHSHLGNGLRRLNHFEEALASYDKAIALKPNHADAFNNRGITLWDLKRQQEALASYDKPIALKPEFLEAHSNRGNALRDLHRPQEALVSYDRAISLQPNNPEIYSRRGNVLMDLERFAEALVSYERAIELKLNFVAGYINRGIALFELKRVDEAIASYDHAIGLRPGQSEAYNNRGNALRYLKRNEEAVADFDKAIALDPEYFAAHWNRGNTMCDMRRWVEALASYDAAIALNQHHAGAFNNRGVTLWNLKRLPEALESYDKSIKLNPNHADAYNNRGAALLDMKCPAEALASFDKAITLNPHYADACQNAGKAWTELRRFDNAFAAYDRLYGLEPNRIGVEGHRLNAKMHLCNWRDIESESAHLTWSVRDGFAATQPFFFLAVSSSPDDQLQCGKSWVKAHYPILKPVWRGEKYNHDRIRVAYVSANFRQHPSSYLMAGLYECHDKSRFEITAISLGTSDASDMRQRLLLSFERFIDVDSFTDDEIAELIRGLEIDILVDLMGYTTNSRTAIFARRPAPIQVSYLGYPGTMGASFIDYLIADQIVIPEHHREFYSENAIFMPDSYFVNDFRRPIAAIKPSRAELGLPSKGFVFCCFNNSYKITPTVFDCWMRILRRVPNSVLWLLASSVGATDNLRKEAVARGVDANRLVFARNMSSPDHLARHWAADLCLDTLPYNAHTTACDALWACKPILTCIGGTFVGRVAASLLYALRLPELVTMTLQDYEELAVELATRPEKLGAINRKLADNRDTTPLFDTMLFTERVETAFSELNKRQRNGMGLSDLFVLDSLAGPPSPVTKPANVLGTRVDVAGKVRPHAGKR